MEPWDPDSVQTGINGSEETVIYMSQKLADLGYKVLVFGDPPLNSKHGHPDANPRFVNLDYNEGSTLDIAISWRMPDVASLLRARAKKVYLWPHDTCSFSLTTTQINGFDDVLWLSEWQRAQWISINPGFAQFTHIFGNGINSELIEPLQKKENPYACIYASNYARGLEILLDIWPEIKSQYPKATLDIYYGWQHWGLLSDEKVARMRAQIHEYASLDVREHGQVGHDELNKAFAKTSLWTYPCIGLETFCITALRAQCAGAFPVIIEGSALKETVRHGFKCFNPSAYRSTLLKAMEQIDKVTLDERKKMREFILAEYSWDHLARQWKELFDQGA